MVTLKNERRGEKDGDIASDQNCQGTHDVYVGTVGLSEMKA